MPVQSHVPSPRCCGRIRKSTTKASSPGGNVQATAVSQGTAGLRAGGHVEPAHAPQVQHGTVLCRAVVCPGHAHPTRSGGGRARRVSRAAPRRCVGNGAAARVANAANHVHTA